MFLLKSITSQLQPCDAGIIRNFKIKYRKQLLKHVSSRKKGIWNYSRDWSFTVYEIAESSIRADTKDTIKHCFKEYGFSEELFLAEEPYEKFEDLLKSLDINVMSDMSIRNLAMMLIHQKCQSMCKIKDGKISYVGNG